MTGRSATDGDGRGSGLGRPNAVRRTGALAGGVAGGIAGVLFVAPKIVVTPEWAYLTIPLLLAAAFSASLAYLPVGPGRPSLLRTMAVAFAAALLCALVNLAFLFAVLSGVYESTGNVLPGRLLAHLVEALIVGVAAGAYAATADARGGTRPLALWTAAGFSLVAVVALLLIGSAVLPVAFGAP